jgi:hypothetical protein
MIRWLRNELTIVWSTHRKWGVALLALAGTAVDQSLLTGSALHWVQIGIAAATALGVRAVANTPDPADPGDSGEVDLVLLLLIVVTFGVIALCAGWLPK